MEALTLDSSAAAGLFFRDAEGGPATTRGDDVRVVHLEAAAHERLGVVNLGSVHVVEARLVDDDLDSVDVEDAVVALRLVECKRVLEARATAPAHAYAQSGGVLAFQETLHLLGSNRGQRHHRQEKCTHG